MMLQECLIAYVYVYMFVLQEKKLYSVLYKPLDNEKYAKCRMFRIVFSGSVPSVPVGVHVRIVIVEL